MTRKEIYAAMQAEWVKLTGANVGTTVKIVRDFSEGEQGFDAGGISGRIGQTFVIKAINTNNISDGICVFPYFALSIEEVPTTVEIKGGTVSVSDKTVDCGCCHLTHTQAKAAMKNFNDLSNTFSGYSLTLKVEDYEITRENVSDLLKILG